MRICLLGPSYPFRGGIAHHTTLLYRHLRVRHQVSFYAFRRQYPRWLFPGPSDRDPSHNPLWEEGVVYRLDPLNPLTWVQLVRAIQRDAPDWIIIPWWSSFWALPFWVITVMLQRDGVGRILFLCHNVVDHEETFVSRYCSRLVLRNGHTCLVHSSQDAQRLRSLLPSSQVVHGFHPLYDCFQDQRLSKSEAQARLGIHGDTILFFGIIRPYKGLEDLLEAMPLILCRRKIVLLIVGEYWGKAGHMLRRLHELEREGSARVILRYIPNEDVGRYFAAADLVVLPYKAGSASGVVQIAYALEKPVVATRVGALPEVVQEGCTGYLVDPGDPPALAEAVLRFFEEKKADEFIENIRQMRTRYSWERLVFLLERVMTRQNLSACMTQK